MGGEKPFYAFGTGERSCVLQIASILKSKRGPQINPSPRCGGLHADVGTKTAKSATPSIQQGCQAGKR